MDYANWVRTFLGLYYASYFTFRIFFVFITPIISLITLNYLLFRALRKAKDKRTQLLKTKFRLIGASNSTAGAAGGSNCLGSGANSSAAPNFVAAAASTFAAGESSYIIAGTEVAPTGPEVGASEKSRSTERPLAETTTTTATNTNTNTTTTTHARRQKGEISPAAADKDEVDDDDEEDDDEEDEDELSRWSDEDDYDDDEDSLCLECAACNTTTGSEPVAVERRGSQECRHCFTAAPRDGATSAAAADRPQQQQLRQISQCSSLTGGADEDNSTQNMLSAAEGATESASIRDDDADEFTTGDAHQTRRPVQRKSSSIESRLLAAGGRRKGRPACHSQGGRQQRKLAKTSGSRASGTCCSVSEPTCINCNEVLRIRAGGKQEDAQTAKSAHASSTNSLLQVQATSSGAAHQNKAAQELVEERPHSVIGFGFGGGGGGLSRRQKSPSLASSINCARGSRATLLGGGGGGGGGGAALKLSVATAATATSTSRHIDSSRTTLMLVVVVTVFLMVEVPVATVTIVHVLLNTFDIFMGDELNASLNYIKLFTNFFIMISYSVNFTIYCSMSKKFRETFRDLFSRDPKRRRYLQQQQQQHQQSQWNNTQVPSGCLNTSFRPSPQPPPAASGRHSLAVQSCAGSYADGASSAAAPAATLRPPKFSTRAASKTQL